MEVGGSAFFCSLYQAIIVDFNSFYFIFGEVGEGLLCFQSRLKRAPSSSETGEKLSISEDCFFSLTSLFCFFSL